MCNLAQIGLLQPAVKRQQVRKAWVNMMHQHTHPLKEAHKVSEVLMPVFVVKCNLMGDEGGQRGPLTPGILHTLFLSTWHAGHVLQIAPGIEEAMVIQTLVLIH